LSDLHPTSNCFPRFSQKTTGHLLNSTIQAPGAPNPSVVAAWCTRPSPPSRAAHLPELATAVHANSQHLRPSPRARGECPLLLPLSWLLFPVNARQGPPRVSSPPGCPRSMPNQLCHSRVGAHGAAARCQRGRHSPTRAVRRPAPPPVRPCPCRSVLAWLTLRRDQHSPARAPRGLRSTPHSPRAFVRCVSAPSQRAVGVSITFVYP
jgi:hypothetical protein